MPIYVYMNQQTGERIELRMTIAELVARQNDDGLILHDGIVLKRDLQGEHCSFKATPGNWPMLSDAAGVHPSQIGEAHKESVGMGVPTHFNKESGQAIFESRSHRKAFLKAKGMYDRSAGYGD